MLTVLIILVIAAFLVTLASAAWTPPKAPLWVSVLLLCVIELIRVLPLGK